ncbi:MAG: tRNA (guanosine(46)-N7)-methyltransferase TrmB, partial [Candidatus Saccharimonadaceae bacterium]
VEIGAGTALFSVELASRYPDRVFIALDVKADRLQKGAREAMDRGLKNIYFVRARADQLLEVVQPSSVDHLWLTFSDPFPKKRDAKRRLVAPVFLGLYRQVLEKNGVLCQKTDNHELFDWSLETLVANHWHITELSYDLHESTLSEDYKIMTTYEARFIAEGLVTYFVCAR